MNLSIKMTCNRNCHRQVPANARSILVLAIASLVLGAGCKPEATPIEAMSPSDLPRKEVADQLEANEKEQLKNSESIAGSSVTAELTSQFEALGAKVATKSGTISELNFRGTDVTDEAAKLVGSQAKLVRLTINQSAMSDAGWKELANLSELQQLDLRDCSVNNSQLTSALAGMPKLRALRLNGKSSVDDTALASLANCPDIKALALDHLWVGSDGLEVLKGNTKLAELYLAGTLADDETMDLVKTIPNLRKLRLAQTSVSDIGLEKISQLKIEDLDVSECSQLSDTALAALGKIKSLKKLNLWRDAITDEGVSQLAGLTELKWLNLDNTQATDAGLKHLKNMSQLEFLHLGSTGVSDAGMPDIVALQSLKDLKVTRTAVTEAGVELVEKGIANVNVQLKYVEGQ